MLHPFSPSETSEHILVSPAYEYIKILLRFVSEEARAEIAASVGGSLMDYAEQLVGCLTYRERDLAALELDRLGLAMGWDSDASSTVATRPRIES